MLRYAASFALIALVVTTVGLTGCRSGSGGGKTATSTPMATGIPATATPDLTQPDAIRSISLDQLGEVRKIEIESQGSRFDPGLVIYADLTEDGNQDAIVPITQGGAGAITGFVVLTPDVTRSSHVRSILSESGSLALGRLAIRVENNKLIETQGVPGPDDPECCPSMLKLITYDWNGTMLVPGETKTIPNPAGGVKGTPAATAIP